MADDDRIAALEGRIAELENQLAGRAKRAGPPAAELTQDDLAAFQRVRDVLATDWGDFCGINDCFRCRICRVCTTCVICRVCRVCDVECICGPCNVGGMVGGPGGFSSFGG
jgi:hypothetical protein